MTIQPTHSFVRDVKRLNKKFPSLKSDLTKLKKQLEDDPHSGESLGRNCYKVRMAIKSKNKGKSGGSRVITCVKIENDTLFLLTIYDKSEREDITDEELTDLLKET